MPAYGAQQQYFDPGHHPLHWSDYTPSMMVPFYPASAFTLDVGSHSIIWPCADPGMCAYATWDPMNPNGYVFPWAGIGGTSTAPLSNAELQNAITYATVNVHQAQVSFAAPVGKVFNAPIQPIGLMALTDPVHINTFRFYLEEAGLTFGPCQNPPATFLGYNGLPPTGNPNGQSGMQDPFFPLGQDHFFDPTNYPFPATGGVFNSVRSKLPVTCAEGLATTDPTLLSAIDTPVGNGTMVVPGTTSTLRTPASTPPPSPPSPSPNGGPYGQVLDIIAPEPLAIQGILQADGLNNAGSGGPAYQELWVPHWDAYLCSGPSTRSCPLSAPATCNGGSGPGCPGQLVSGWATLTSTQYPAAPVPLGSTSYAASGVACAADQTGADGLDPYCPQLVQFALDALQTYVWKGGNLFSECIGAASMEDVTMRYLLGEWGINQTSTHFMSEWDNDSDGIAAYYPNPSYYSTNTAGHNGGQFPPAWVGNMGTCGGGVASCSIGQTTATASVCSGQGSPTNLCGMNAQQNNANFPFGEPPTSLAIGWAGDQVLPAPGVPPLPNSAVQLSIASNGLVDAQSRKVFQFNAMGGQNPPGSGSCCQNSDCAGGLVCGGADCSHGINGACQDPVHVVWYTPPSAWGGSDFPTGSLADPLLQVGDFYFEGINGATESWEQGVRGNEGYASNCDNPDTYPLIRGMAGTCTSVNADGSCNAVSLTGFDTTQQDGNGPYYGDYWVYNRNSATGEAGQVIYLGGDSYDGRPDGLRLIWSSMMDLAYSPSGSELARSSGAPYQPSTTTSPNDYHTDLVSGLGSYLMQGTFVQATMPSNATTVYTGHTDMPNWAYPAELGHFRQNDMNAADSCLNAAGTSANPLACQSAVGANNLGNQGSNSVNYVGLGLDGTWNFWDTSGPKPVPATSTRSLMIDDDVGGVGGGKHSSGTDNAVVDRVLFTHLYEKLPSDAVSGGVGLHPVWLNPQNANYPSGGTKLECALFPTAAACGGSGINNVACPDGIHCIAGPLACAQTCTVDANGNPVVLAPASLNNGTCTSEGACYAAHSDVGALLAAVSDATGGPGCVPLLQDTCYPVGSPQVQCLDTCWAQCYQQCQPASAQPPFNCQNQNPGFNVGMCGHDCAAKCNGNHGMGVGGANCGVGMASSPSAFRQLCYPSIGGIDHSTPVIVGPASSQIPEFYARNPAQVCSNSATDANCVQAQKRPTVAYVGAADGFVHAIYVEDGTDPDCGHFNQYVPGQEIWAFMPNQQLPLLPTNGSCAQSLFVDGVPVVKDVYADLGNGAGPGWHTILTMTEGVGGNHLFALDVTDPMAPVRGAPACHGPGVSQSTLDSVRLVLWENGDPLDTSDFWPLLTSSTHGGPNVTYQLPGTTSFKYVDDLAHEGPGFPQNGGGLIQPVPQPPSAVGVQGTFNHYLGGASSVFMGQILGSGSQEDLTYVAGQNSPHDAYGRAIVLSHCSAGCNPKDFHAANSGHGPQGEVVYAFDSATGAPKAQLSSTGSTLAHFSSLYLTKPSSGYRSSGNNDIPAPPLGITLSGRPETELVVVPDLDGQVWGLLPGTLASSHTAPGYAYAPFPLFDIERYAGGYPPLFGSGWVPPTLPVGLNVGAPFANPGAYVAPGTCSGFNDPGAEGVARLFEDLARR